MRIAVGIVIVAALLLVPRLAAAETAPSPTVPSKKSPSLAFGLSFGTSLLSIVALPVAAFSGDGTIAGLGLAVAVAAPSVGTAYVGRPLTTGLAIRAGGAALALTIIGSNESCGIADHDECTQSDLEENLLMVGLGAIVVGTIADWVAAPRAARAHNRRVEQMTIAPIVTRDGGGLALSGQF